MSEISGVSGASRYFSADEEEKLNKEESSSSIVKRGTGAKTEIRGDDKTWRETKNEQKSHVGASGAAHIGHGAVEALELGGLIHLGALGPIGGALGGMALGIHEIKEAHERGEQQATAAARDTQHVAMTAALDIPESFKQSELDGRYKNVPRGFNSEAMKMVEKMKADPKALAVLQHHADCGMKAAADCIQSGQNRAKFLESHPSVKQRLDTDPAFRAGFDSYSAAKPEERTEAESAWNARDARSSQPQTVRG